jgi:hypothetical protein
MKVTVEFDMVDMSMYKHETLFKSILKRYGAGIRSIKIVEPNSNNSCFGVCNCKDKKHDDKTHS